MSDDDVDDAPEAQSGPPDPEQERKLPRYTKDELTCVLDEHGREHYWTPEGRAVCGRKRKEKNAVIEDERCLAPPMPSGCCKVHGGSAGPPIKHGRYSRSMTVWRAAFQQALSDEDLLDTRRELALMDTVTERLVEEAEDLDCPSWRGELRETFGLLQRAIRSQRQTDVGALMKKLGEHIERGATAAQVSHDIVIQVDKRAARAGKMSELMLRRQEKVTFEDITALLRQFLEVLEKELEPALYFRLLPSLKKVTQGTVSLGTSGQAG